MENTTSLRHVLNGDAMQECFEQSGVPGSWTIWREAVIDGPVAFDMASAELRDLRAHALAQHYGIDSEEYVDDFDRRERFLAECADGDELVLWFEEDCFCELHLIDLLGRTSARPGLRVSVVHLPMATCEPELLKAGFQDRHEAALECRSEARELWRHYCEADPRAFVSWRARDPWLDAIARALQRDFVGRFADARGLSCFDAVMLAQLAEQRASPKSLFELSRRDPALARLGLGDLQVDVRLQDLAQRGAITLHEQTVEATPLGRAALAGEQVVEPPRGPIGGADPTRWCRHGDSLVAC